MKHIIIADSFEDAQAVARELHFMIHEWEYAWEPTKVNTEGCRCKCERNAVIVTPPYG